MAKDLTEIEGFEQLNRKLKQLPDKVKRREVLKIQRQLAKPIISAYSQALPVGKKDKTRNGTTYPKGTLSKSVKAETVPARKTGGNPSIAIRPGKKGKYNAYYRFMVVKKGFKGSGPGSRKGAANVVEDARNKALARTGAQATKMAGDKVAAYVQKQIIKLGE